MIPRALNTSQFVEYKEAIQMLYQIDDDFKTLCDDYLVSKETFQRFREKTIEDQQLELEYKRLSGSFETEILEYILKRR